MYFNTASPTADDSNPPLAPRTAPKNTETLPARKTRGPDLQSVLVEKEILRVEMETEKLRVEKEKLELEKRKLILEIQLLEQRVVYTTDNDSIFINM